MDKLTTKFQQALSDAQSVAVGQDNQFIEPVHLLLALLQQEASACHGEWHRAHLPHDLMRDRILHGSASAGPGAYLLRTKVWHHGFRKEVHGAHHFVVRQAPKGKVAPKVGDPCLL